jgi:lysophospholipase L1-like esterase
MDDRLRIVTFGDSVTDAVGHFDVTEATSFRGRLGEVLRREFQREVQMINAGIGGDITRSAVKRLDRHVLAHHPHLVTVMFGVNDAGFYRPDSQTFADTPRVEIEEFTILLEEIVICIQSFPALAVLMTPLPMNEHYWGRDHPPYVAHGLNYLVKEYAQRVIDVASRRGAPAVDLYHHFEAHPETADLVPDGIHPNAEGHRVICDLLAPVVCEALRQM